MNSPEHWWVKNLDQNFWTCLKCGIIKTRVNGRCAGADPPPQEIHIGRHRYIRIDRVATIKLDHEY